MRVRSLLPLVLSFTLISCVHDQETEFNVTESESSFSLEDGVLNGADPLGGYGVVDGQDGTGQPGGMDGGVDGDGSGYPNGNDGDSEAYVNCDFDLKVTSANGGVPFGSTVSETKVIIGSEDYIRSQLNEMGDADKNYFIHGLDQKLPLRQMNFQQTSSHENIEMAFANDARFQLTSAHGDLYRIYAQKSLDYQTTSHKSEQLRLLAHGKLKVRSTSYKVAGAIMMLVTDDSEINVCIRETAAGSLDLDIVGAENTNVNVISQGTSFKDTVIRSSIASAANASQKWKGTGFNNSSVEIINDAFVSNHTELKFTAFHQGSVAHITQAGEEASAYVHGTNKGANSEIKIINQALMGTALMADIKHGTAGNKYRDYEGMIEGLGQEELLE